MNRIGCSAGRKCDWGGVMKVFANGVLRAVLAVGVILGAESGVCAADTISQTGTLASPAIAAAQATLTRAKNRRRLCSRDSQGVLSGSELLGP